MLIYFIRHGETDWNKEYRLQGQSDIPLNEKGEELARITGEAMREVKLDCAFTSPLIRAKKTAQLIIGDRDIKLVEDERLKEISFGVQEGHYGRDSRGVPLMEFYDFYERPDIYKAPEKGENVEMLCRRTWDFLEDITTRSELLDKSVLVATHGAALQSMLLWIKKLPFADLWKSGLKKNCSVTIVEVKDGKVRILEEGKVYA